MENLDKYPQQITSSEFIYLFDEFKYYFSSICVFIEIRKACEFFTVDYKQLKMYTRHTLYFMQSREMKEEVTKHFR